MMIILGLINDLPVILCCLNYRLFGSENDDENERHDADHVAFNEMSDDSKLDENDGAVNKDAEDDNQKEVDSESFYVKSLSQTYEKSSYHHARIGAQALPFNLRKQACMSVFANRSQSRRTTLPEIFRRQHGSSKEENSSANGSKPRSNH